PSPTSSPPPPPPPPPLAAFPTRRSSDLPLVGAFLSGDHPEQGRLAGSVRPDHADDAAGREREGHVLDEEAVSEAFADAVGLDHRSEDTRLNSSHRTISYAVFCLKKKKQT